MKKILFVFSLVLLSACTEVQHSSSQAFDNANSVLKNGTKNEPIWMEPEETTAKESKQE